MRTEGRVPNSDREVIMTHEEAFLASILENPDDDAPRLIYADWLDEQGRHDRAEFIRIQCELATYGEYRCRKWNAGMDDTLWGYPLVVEDAKPCSCVWCCLKGGERKFLLATRAWQWSGFPQLEIGADAYRIRRGF